MKTWTEIKSFGVPVLSWWELLVKPGIRKLAVERSKELNREKRSKLNLLMLQQSFLTSKLQAGEYGKLDLLPQTQVQIENWFATEVDKVKLQSRVDDIQLSEKIRIFHHELHKKHRSASSITKLKVGNQILAGHEACSNYLQLTVAEILGNPANLDAESQKVLLDELEVKFTAQNNEMLNAIPTKSDIKAAVFSSNSDAAPGNDGLTNLLYKECFEILGDALTDVVVAIHSGQ